MVEYFQNEDKSVMLLDTGALFGDEKDTAEFSLKAMEILKYDALNIAAAELQFGKGFLEHTRSQVTFPYIASNLLYNGVKPPWAHEYIIKNKGGIRVAILGILDPDDLKELSPQELAKGWQVVPPEAALQKLMPEVKEKADLVILLSQLSTTKTLAMITSVKGIHAAIYSGSVDLALGTLPEDVVILPTGNQGRVLGLIKFTLDEKMVPRVSEKLDILLDKSIPDDEAMANLVKAHTKKLMGKKEEEKKALLENLKLSPEQFMELYRKEQAEQGKGEAK